MTSTVDLELCWRTFRLSTDMSAFQKPSSEKSSPNPLMLPYELELQPWRPAL